MGQKATATVRSGKELAKDHARQRKERIRLQAIEREQKVKEQINVHNKTGARVTNIPPLHTFISKYSDKFLRDPTSYELKTKSKDKDKQLYELVRHTFAKYPVCFPLASVWRFKQERYNGPMQRDYYGRQRQEELDRQSAEKPELAAAGIGDIDFRNWYICVATGGSLYKECAKDYLTKKEVHVFLTCPHQLDTEAALCYAIAKAACGNEGVALRIAKTKLVEKRAWYSDFWRTVIRFFATHEAQTINQINDLVDYISYEKGRPNEFVGGVQTFKNTFTMAGKTIPVLTKKMTDWHHALRRVKVMGNYSWEGAPLDNDTVKRVDQYGNEEQWHFYQIKTSKELAAEGTRMRHCVYSYRDRCINHQLSIWSLQKIDKWGQMTPRLTIELTNSGKIVQARGTANRSAKADERNVMERWARQNGLTMGSYV